MHRKVIVLSLSCSRMIIKGADYRCCACLGHSLWRLAKHRLIINLHANPDTDPQNGAWACDGTVSAVHLHCILSFNMV